MSYVVYPGNVGDNNGLCNVAEKLGVKRKFTSTSTNFNYPISTQQIQSIRASNRTFQLLQKEKNNLHAVAAFNIYNLEGAKAVVDAAEELQSSIILQVYFHPSFLSNFFNFLFTLQSLFRLISILIDIFRYILHH